MTWQQGRLPHPGGLWQESISRLCADAMLAQAEAKAGNAHAESDPSASSLCRHQEQGHQVRCRRSDQPAAAVCLGACVQEMARAQTRLRAAELSQRAWPSCWVGFIQKCEKGLSYTLSILSFVHSHATHSSVQQQSRTSCGFRCDPIARVPQTSWGLLDRLCNQSS